MAKNVLEFKLKFSEKETITPYAGLALYEEMYKSLRMDQEVERLFSAPGSGRGYKANEYIEPLILMFIGGGKYMEDVRKIDVDEGLKQICKIGKVPSSDALRAWLARETVKKITGLKILNDNLNRRLLKKAKDTEFTLDIDATGIVGEKLLAAYTYEGDKGYMPILGFVPELDICIGYEFREGNVSPSTRNCEFARGIIEFVDSTGKAIKFFRSDSAAYNSEVFNYLNGRGVRYGITVDKDSAVKEVIEMIKDWKVLKDKDGRATGREYAESVHSMNRTDHSFRIVVQRWPNPDQDLFEKRNEYCYHGIAANFSIEEKSSEEIISWHNGRSNSENYNKEVKLGFNLEYMPSGNFAANAVWFGIGILAYNLFIASKIFLFPKEWAKKTIRTIRWQFIQIAGRIIKHAHELIL
ncbi:MAG: IS1380 family transposase, partial [Elusimicrobiota bacterium]